MYYCDQGHNLIPKYYHCIQNVYIKWKFEATRGKKVNKQTQIERKGKNSPMDNEVAMLQKRLFILFFHSFV